MMKKAPIRPNANENRHLELDIYIQVHHPNYYPEPRKDQTSKLDLKNQTEN